MRTTLLQSALFVDLADCSEKLLNDLYGDCRGVGTEAESNVSVELLNARSYSGPCEESEDFSSTTSSEDCSDVSQDSEHESKILTDSRFVHVSGDEWRRVPHVQDQVI